MKLPYGWLKEFVPEAPPVGETAALLTGGGLKVDSVKPFTTAHEGIVVGEVVRVERHPNADRLTLCTVEAGGAAFEVVCGAPNVRAGRKYPFAQPGARLPGGRTIGAAKIRGVASQGMLCSAAEVGAGGDADGLLELDAKSVPGDPYVPHPDEWVLDLEVTPNRGDALSVLGVARQLAALLGTSWKLPGDRVPPAPGGNAGWSVSVDDPEGCGLYTARLLTGMKIGPAPEWMRNRLLACGMRPINNVVDATNYVLLEMGHPLHAFDLAKLSGTEIRVRRAEAGEIIRTLDGVKRSLSPEVLVIADAKEAVAVAGVMGGASSEISEKTGTVLLESAWFDPVRVRRGARHLGLATESSYRFERGVDPEGVVAASDRAAQLIAGIAGGTTASPLLAARGKLPERRAIAVRAGEVSGVLGIPLPAPRLRRYAELLGADVAGEGDSFSITPPSWRLDLKAPADLVEEFAVLAGYRDIPSTMPVLEAGPPSPARREEGETAVREALLSSGFSEAQTFSFMSRSDLERVQGKDGPGAVVLANPQGEEQELLRTTLLPGLLRAASKNLAREAPGVALFEIGTVFRASPAAGGPAESASLALVGAGRSPQDVHRPARQLDFYDVKGALDSVAESLGIELAWRPENRTPFAGGRGAAVRLGGAEAGFAGELEREAAAAYELPAGTVAAEVALDGLLRSASGTVEVRAPARYPGVRRDLAVVVGEAVPAADVRAEIVRAGGPLLESAGVFDLYRGKQLASGTKSIAFRLVFRSPERTLTEPEADEAVAGIVRALGASLGARLRET